MKKNIKITVKKQVPISTSKPISESTLILSSKKVDQILKIRKKSKNCSEEFTEWE